MPRRRGDGALTRNAIIAGLALASVSVIAGGMAMTGGNRDSEFSFAATSPAKALRIALVDPAAPVVVPRDPRIALDTPASAAPYQLASAPANEPPAQAATTSAASVTTASIPVPMARPAVSAEPPRRLAAIPVPTARPAVASMLPRELLFDAEPTGSLGTLAYAPTVAAKDLAEPATAPAGEILTVPAKQSRERANAPKRREQAATPAPEKPAENHGLIGRLFAKAPSAHEKLYGRVRYAALTPADTGRDDDGGGLPRAPYDNQTAVYVITDKKVYMPDGTTLEAHSGLGSHMDEPDDVRLRMRGATPPHVYDLRMRESLFHGVEAIRLKPIGGESAIFGRDGLLAHPYMLGPRGDSNGCVSFKDYDEFLEAFKAGKISRLAVLARLN